nr:DMT family transporter [uncultured Bacteroides sp.]
MQNNSIKGYIYAALSSSTFGLAPFFTLSLLAAGFSSFEVLAYRWGIASLALAVFGLMLKETFRISRKDWGTVFLLSLLRAATSFSLVIAYQYIASGVASTIHFMYPLAVAVAMMCFFGEKKSFTVLFAISISLIGAGLLSSGEINSGGNNRIIGMIAAVSSVFFYGGYIIGIRKSRAVHIPSMALTCYVMGLGALFFIIGGIFTGGVRLVTDGYTWLNILGLALPASAISNITLVKAIKHIGPTLTSIFGALEPLTAVAIGYSVFHEKFTWESAIGIVFILTAVTVVVMHEKRAHN